MSDTDDAFSLTPVNPQDFFKSNHFHLSSSLQHTAIRKVSRKAFMGNELFLLFPKGLENASISIVIML